MRAVGLPATAFAAPYPGCRAYARLDDLVADDAIDAVFILTPAELHEEMSLAAIERIRSLDGEARVGRLIAGRTP